MFEYLNTLTKTSPFLAGLLSLFGAGILTWVFKDIPKTIIDFIVKRFTTTLSISNMNTSYYTMMSILNSDNVVNKIRNIKFYNGKWGSACELTKGIGVGTHLIQYKSTYLLMKVITEKTQTQDDKLELVIIKLGRSHKIFDELKAEIETYDKKKNNEISVYKFYKEWVFVNSSKLRTFDTIIMDKEKKELLLGSIEKFLSNEDWYIEHGIPYQFGIFLNGESGTGKSSIIKAIASKFGFDICILPVSRLYLLGDAISQLPKNSMIVIEDVDSNSSVIKRDGVIDVNNRLINKNKLYNKDDSDEESIIVEGVLENEEDITTSNNKERYNQEKEMSHYELSDILNSIDGILSIHKRILIMTSNRPNILDPALVRPGRIDVSLYITYVSKEMFIEFLYKFFKDKYNYIDSIKDKIILTNDKLTVSLLQDDYRRNKTIEQFITDYTVFKGEK